MPDYKLKSGSVKIFRKSKWGSKYNCSKKFAAIICIEDAVQCKSSVSIRALKGIWLASTNIFAGIMTDSLSYPYVGLLYDPLRSDIVRRFPTLDS